MIYLDHAATSWPKPDAVGAAMLAALDLGNPGRGAHEAALASGRVLYDARTRAARLLGAASERVVLTHGCTSALNLAIAGLLSPGDHAVTTDLEHNSVLRPLYAARGRGVGLTIVASERGVVAPDAVRAALRPETRLVAVTHASNVLGTVQPIAKIAALCAGRGVTLLVDAAQTAGVLPVTVDAWGPVAVACGGHKGIRGPAGTGMLALGEGVRPRPLEVGGTGFDSASETMPAELPEALEAGTPNVPGFAGLAAALALADLTSTRSLDAARRLRDGLAASGRWTTPAIDEASWGVGVLAGSVTGAGGVPLDSALVADALAERGVAVRGGFHCAPLVHRRYGTAAGMVRFSTGPGTTDADVDAALAAVNDLVDA